MHSSPFIGLLPADPKVCIAKSQINSMMGLQNQMIKNLSQLMAFALISEILISWKLWFPFGREFPMMSAFSWLDFSLGLVGDGILSLGLLVALAFIAIDKQRKPAIILAISCLFVLILEDITRFQPWVYTQGTILILIAFNKTGREKAILSGAMLVVALVYIWSGIQKFNLGFIRDTFPWFLSAYGLDFQSVSNQTIGDFNYIFIIVPLVEFSIGLFLLIHKTRKIAIIAGIVMHLFVLLSLGPTGHNWNMVVWPWNLSLIVFLILYYAPKDEIRISQGIQSFRMNFVVLILFGLMPAFNFLGYWDDALSGSMYSGAHNNVVFFFDSKNEPELTQISKAGTTVTENEKNIDDPYSDSKIWFIYWSIYDLKAPFYPAYRYYSRFGRILCEKAENPLKSGIEITIRSKLNANQIVTKCSCLELLESDDQK